MLSIPVKENPEVCFEGFPWAGWEVFPCSGLQPLALPVYVPGDMSTTIQLTGSTSALESIPAGSVVYYTPDTASGCFSPATTDTMNLYEYRIILTPSDDNPSIVLASGEVFAKSADNARTAAMMDGGSVASGEKPSEVTVLVRRFQGE